MTNRGHLFEKNRREYWSKRPETIDVFRDTHGPTDLAVVFKRSVSWDWNVLLVEAKVNGKLSTQHRQKLEWLLDHKPETVALRIEFLEDLSKSCGHSNTTYTKIRTVDDLDKHAEKVKQLRG